ncbi:MAG: hypothetical protein EYC70_06035 [Planctomycetota bacterium]|nr:MAG: hypothetical protein EYC70_06035 [Planctomycetota bacterium]
MFARTLLPLFAAVALALPIACGSNSSAEDIACTCGTPQADLEGCAHSLCLAGKTNPDNPDCVCGSLSIPR